MRRQILLACLLILVQIIGAAATVSHLSRERTFSIPSSAVDLLSSLRLASNPAMPNAAWTPREFVPNSARNLDSVAISPQLAAASSESVFFNKTWAWAGSDTIAYGMAQDSSGNIYLTGCTGCSYHTGSTNSWLFLLKYDTAGTLIWQKTWVQTQSNPRDEGRGVAVDRSGNIYVAGITVTPHPPSSDSWDLVLLRFRGDGSLAWQRTWGYNQTASGQTNGIDPYAVAADPSGNVFVTGQIHSEYRTNTDVFLVKFDPNGQLMFQEAWASPRFELGHGIAIDANGNVYVTGYTNVSGRQDTDLLLLKFDNNGGRLWQGTWGGNNDDEGESVSLDSSGNVWVTGYTASFGAGGKDVIILKFGSNGGLLSQRTWGGTADDIGYGIAATSSRGIYLVGKTGIDAFVLRQDPSGSIWQRLWGVGNEAHSVIVDAFGSILVSGFVSNPPPYTIRPASNQVNTPEFNIDRPTVTVIQFHREVSTPTGTVSIPPGKEAYVCCTNAFLFKYGPRAHLGVTTDCGGTSCLITVPGEGYYAFGQNVTLTAPETSGERAFSHWIIDGTSTATSDEKLVSAFSLVMNQDHNATAVYLSQQDWIDFTDTIKNILLDLFLDKDKISTYLDAGRAGIPSEEQEMVVDASTPRALKGLAVAGFVISLVIETHQIYEIARDDSLSLDQKQEKLTDILGEQLTFIVCQVAVDVITGGIAAIVAGFGCSYLSGPLYDLVIKPYGPVLVQWASDRLHETWDVIWKDFQLASNMLHSLYRNVITFIIGSDTTVVIIDSSGRRLGGISSSGQVVREIPNSVYNGIGMYPQKFVIANPLTDNYRIHVANLQDGSVHFTSTMYANWAQTGSTEYVQTLSKGDFDYTFNPQTITFVPPPGPWWSSPLVIALGIVVAGAMITIAVWRLPDRLRKTLTIERKMDNPPSKNTSKSYVLPLPSPEKG